MEKLVRGIISNVIINYIEYKEDVGYGRHKTTIRKHTSFSVENNTFYTFEDIEPTEGKEEVFYASEENKITFFGKKQVEENLEKRNKGIIDEKKSINNLMSLSFISVLLSIIMTFSILLRVQDVPVIIGFLMFIMLIFFFLLSIASFFGIVSSKKELNDLKEKVKKEKNEFDIFNRTTLDLISIKEKEKIQLLKEDINVINL